MPAMVIGQVLRDARRRRGLSQHILGAPFSAAFISSVEHGKTIPSLPSLAILTARLEMSLADFFREVERRRGALAPRRKAAVRDAPGLVPAGAQSRSESLTPRERDVLSGLMDGRSNDEIAAHLFISRKTVEAHLSRLFLRAGALSRTELALRADRERWLDLPPGDARSPRDRVVAKLGKDPEDTASSGSSESAVVLLPRPTRSRDFPR